MVTGVGTFFSYSQTQSYNLATKDIEAVIQLAKSRSLSRVKPTECGTQTLRLYEVAFDLSNQEYSLNAVCGTTTYPIQTKKLPADVTFDAITDTTITFAVATGIVDPAPRSVIITGFGRTTTITVASTGTVTVQ